MEPKKRDKQKDAYCQDCAKYKRPVCYINGSEPKFTARKNTCPYFRLRK